MTSSPWPEYDHRNRERPRNPGRVFHTPLREAHFGRLCRVAVPPVCIHPCRDKTNHKRTAVSGFLVGFLHPLAYLPAIGRVHKHPLICPALSKSVRFWGVVPLALRGIRPAARV